MPDKEVKYKHGGHRERMRERFSKSGFDNYQPHEVLEQLLFGCIPRANTNPIGHDLIARFGSVMGVLEASQEELMKVDGIGPKSAEYIASVKPTVERMICEQYSTMGAVNDEMSTFIADWFMRGKPNAVGLIVCEKNGVFKDFVSLTEADENGVLPEWNVLGDMIAETAGECKYIIVFGETCSVNRSTAYRLLDHTAARGAVMTNAYVKTGTKLESLLF